MTLASGVSEQDPALATLLRNLHIYTVRCESQIPARLTLIIIIQLETTADLTKRDTIQAPIARIIWSPDGSVPALLNTPADGVHVVVQPLKPSIGNHPNDIFCHITVHHFKLVCRSDSPHLLCSYLL